MGAPMQEAYGQTECSGVCTATWATDPKNGYVGGPVNCCDIRLQDVPDMDYRSTDMTNG